jgi:glycosyltransferase involved in cell wall biosynthesis
VVSWIVFRDGRAIHEITRNQIDDSMTTIKLLTIVEATTVNAVAKTVLEFYRAARELSRDATDFPLIDGCLATFDRQRDGNGAPNDFVAAACAQGLEVETIPERRRFDLRVIPALRLIVESRGSDLLITNSVKSHFLVWRSGLWRRHPWVAFHHGYTDTDRKMRLYNRLDRWSLPHADRLVTVCRAFADELASTGVSINKISVQHNSIRRQSKVNSADVTALRASLGIGDGEKLVLAVGRLSREKAHRDLIAAFKHLRETNRDLQLKLVIVGDGPERSSLEAYAESLGVNEMVVFAGQVNDVQPFYTVADVFALPSHSEGSPNVLLEAMAANLPVVATAVGGVPEIVENNTSALLVPANDPRALGASMARLLTDEELRERLVKNAAELVDTRFTPDNYARALVGIYREVIERRRA